jgi:outer membrane protein assembly factor BamB
MVLEETDAGVYLYHGNTIDKRGRASPCQLRKLDALTGRLIWQHDVPCVYESYLNGGLLATPLLGQDDLADLVIFNVCKTTSHAAGTLLALDKQSGKVVWERKLEAYSWSSPLAIKGTDGKSYGILADSAGDMHLFDPRTGQNLDTISLGQNCEASPAAYGNRIVVATYARKIYCVEVR